MELLDLPALADHAGLTVEQTQRYHEQFFFFVPAARVGGTLRFLPDAIEVLRLIHDHAERGATPGGIAEALEAAYPVTILASLPTELAPSDEASIVASAHALTHPTHVPGAEEGNGVSATQESPTVATALAEIRAGQAALRAEVAALAGLHTDLAELRAKVEERPAGADETLQRIIAMLPQALQQLHGELLAIRAEVERSSAHAPARPSAARPRGGAGPLPTAPATESGDTPATAGSEPQHATPSESKHTPHRRRLGQPQKLRSVG
jgi:DNA-binding transcriptional MerR regulator